MVTNTEDDEDSLEDPIDYKTQYRNFKRKLKLLIYENECFQEALRSNQRRMLKVTRDRSFLLDRLLNYEKVEASWSEGDDTESSDDEARRQKPAAQPAKKKKSVAARLVKTQPVDGQSVEAEARTEARRHMMDLDRTPLPVPSDMFSNEPSLDSESNEMCDLDTTSPTHLPDHCLNNEYILPD